MVGQLLHDVQRHSGAGHVGYTGVLQGCELLSNFVSLTNCKQHLTAAQYVTATGLMEMLSGADAEYPDDLLSSLLSVLYPLPDGKSTVRPAGHISHTEKMAVMFNFQAVLEWISRIPKYDLLFHHAQGTKYSSPLGMEGSLYTLSEKGYGDIDKVGGMNLFTYLDVLLKQTVDSIHSLNSCKMKPQEIASELNLSVEQVLGIITKS